MRDCLRVDTLQVINYGSELTDKRPTGYARQSWNSGVLPSTLTDDDGTKRQWDKLTQPEKDAAFELDYSPETWNQTDTLQTMDSSALRATMGWFQRKAHDAGSVKDVKDYEGGQEALEFHLLRCAREARQTFEDSTPASRAREVDKVSRGIDGEDDQFRECWLQTKIVSEAHGLVSLQQKRQCEARSIKTRLLKPNSDAESTETAAVAAVSSFDKRVLSFDKRVLAARGNGDFKLLASERVNEMLGKDPGLTNVFSVLSNEMCKTAVALYDELVLDTEKSMSVTSSAVFEAKFNLRASYEFTMHLLTALQQCATAKVSANASLQSVLVQKWNALSEQQQLYLNKLGYEDGTKWDARSLSAIAQKQWTDEDLSSTVEAAAVALKLDGEQWSDWQEEWSEQVVTPEQSRWADLDEDQRTAAKTLGYTARSWNHAKPLNKFLRPWGKDENRITVTVKIGQSVEDEKVVRLDRDDILQVKSIETSWKGHIVSVGESADNADRFTATLVDMHGKDWAIPDPSSSSGIWDAPRRLSVRVTKTNAQTLTNDIKDKETERAEALDELRKLKDAANDTSNEIDEVAFQNPVATTFGQENDAASFEMEDSRDLEIGSLSPFEDTSLETGGSLSPHEYAASDEPDSESAKVDPAIANLNERIEDIEKVLEEKRRSLANLSPGWELDMEWEVTVVVEKKVTSVRPEDEPLTGPEREAAAVLGYTEARWSAWKFDGALWKAIPTEIQNELDRLGYDEESWDAHKTIFRHDEFVSSQIFDAQNEKEKNVVVWDDVRGAAEYLAALQSLLLLSPPGDGSDSDTRYQSIIEKWEPPQIERSAEVERHTALWDDVGPNSQNAKFKSAVEKLGLTAEDWGSMLSDGSKENIQTILDTKGVRSFMKQMHLAQIYQACINLSIGKAQWIGDIDYVRWQSLNAEQIKNAKILGFDKTSWNRRSHTPITALEWDKIAKPAGRGLPFRDKRPADEESFVQSVKEAAGKLWSLKEEDMMKRWDLIAKFATLAWKDLEEEQRAIALTVDIDRKKWISLTKHIRGANVTATTEISSFKSLLSESAGQGGIEKSGKIVFEDLVNAVTNQFSGFFQKQTRELLKKCRVSMENTCVISRKGVARARRSLRDTSEDEIRKVANKEKKRKAEASAMAKFFLVKWSSLESNQRKGAERLGFVSDRTVVEQLCADKIQKIKMPTGDFDFDEAFTKHVPSNSAEATPAGVDVVKAALMKYVQEAFAMSPEQEAIAMEIAAIAVAHGCTESQATFLEVLVQLVIESRANDVVEQTKAARLPLQEPSAESTEDSERARKERLSNLQSVETAAAEAAMNAKNISDKADTCLAWDNKMLPMHMDKDQGDDAKLETLWFNVWCGLLSQHLVSASPALSLSVYQYESRSLSLKQ
eukprot:SAG11_NODE_753_length_7341_cov_4.014637_4_plen_1394_part_00